MVLEAKSHASYCKNHFEAQRLRIFEYTTYNSHFKLFDYMASNTDVVDGVWGDLTPLVGSNINVTTKRH